MAVQNVLDGQRETPTKWREHFVKNVDNKQIPVYINPDKNAKLTRTEIGVKQTLNILRDLYGNLEFQVPVKAEGIILVGWKKLVKVEAVDASTTVLRWWSDQPEQSKIDKVEVATRFEAVHGSGGVGSWS